jgi:hypothetical protein
MLIQNNTVTKSVDEYNNSMPPINHFKTNPIHKNSGGESVNRKMSLAAKAG